MKTPFLKQVIFFLIFLSIFISKPGYAYDLDHVIVYWTQNGSSQSHTVNATGTYNISRDPGTQVDVRIYKSSTAPTPSTFSWVAPPVSSGEEVSSNNTSVYFSNVAPSGLQYVQCMVNLVAGYVRIYVTDLPSQYPDLGLQMLRLNGQSYQSGYQFAVGQTITASCRVINTGTVEAGSSKTGFYIGTSSSDYSDRYDYKNTGSLDPNGGIEDEISDTYTFTVDDIGTRYLNFWADYKDVVEEGTAEGNNKQTWGSFTVIGAPVADILDISYPAGPINPNEPFILNVYMKNLGTVSAVDGGISVSFPDVTAVNTAVNPSDYESPQANVYFQSSSTLPNRTAYGNGTTIWDANGTSMTNHYLLMEATKSSWPVNGDAVLYLMIYPKQPGAFHMKIRCWLSGTSSISRDPASTGTGIGTDQQGYYTFDKEITVNNAMPDLTVTAMNTPSTGEPGATYNVTVSVQNIGNLSSPASPGQIRISNDQNFDNGTFLANYIFSAISPGETVTSTSFQITIPYSGFSGNCYLIYKTNFDNSFLESNVTNNSLPKPIIIGVAPVISITEPQTNISVPQGSPVTISWNANGPSGASVTLKYDLDTDPGNANETTIASDLPLTDTYSWPTDDVPLNTYHVLGIVNGSTGSQATYSPGTVTVYNSSTYTISGTAVSDLHNFDKIPGAIVTLDGNSTQSTTTAWDGSYSLGNIPVGQHTISIMHNGYFWTQSSFTLNVDQDKIQDFSGHCKSVPLVTYDIPATFTPGTPFDITVRLKNVNIAVQDVSAYLDVSFPDLTSSTTSVAFTGQSGFDADPVFKQPGENICKIDLAGGAMDCNYPAEYLLVSAVRTATIFNNQEWSYSLRITPPPSTTFRVFIKGSIGDQRDPVSGVIGQQGLWEKEVVLQNIAPPGITIPILMYHNVNDVAYSEYWVAVDNFARQMNYLDAYGFTPISLSDILSYRNNGTALPAKPVVLTFDDGYQNFYTKAYPILHDHNFTATSFLISDYVGIDESQRRTNDWDAEPENSLNVPHLIWPEVQIMAQNEIEFHAHSKTHLNLESLSQQSELDDQILTPRNVIMGQLGDCDFFSYPYGGHNANVVNTVSATGYLGAVDIDHGGYFNTQTSNIYLMERQYIPSSMDLNAFALKVDPSLEFPELLIQSVSFYDQNGNPKTEFLPGETVMTKVQFINNGPDITTILSLNLDKDNDDSTPPVYDSHLTTPNADIIATISNGEVKTVVFPWVILQDADAGQWYYNIGFHCQNYILWFGGSGWQEGFTVSDMLSLFWNSYMSNPQNLGNLPVNIPTNVTAKFNPVEIPIGPRNLAIIPAPSIYQNKAVFVSGMDGKVYCYSLDNGSQNWVSMINSGVIYPSFSSQPAISENIVVIGTASDRKALVGLNIETGEEIWSYNVNGIIWSSPKIYDHNVYINCDGFIHCIDLLSGNLNWKIRIYTGLGWPYKTSYNYGTVAVSEGGSRIITPYGGINALEGANEIEGGIMCIDGNTQQILWSINLSNSSNSTPVIYNGYIYFNDEDDLLWKIDLFYEVSFNKTWIESGVMGVPSISNDKIFINKNTNAFFDIELFALDLNGNLLWNYDKPWNKNYNNPTTSKNMVFIGTDDGFIAGIDQSNGIPLFEYAIDYPSDVVITNQGEIVILSGVPTSFQSAKEVFYVLEGSGDNQPPSCELLNPNQGGDYKGNIIIEAQANDNNTVSFVEFQYSLDNEHWDIIPAGTADDPLNNGRDYNPNDGWGFTFNSIEPDEPVGFIGNLNSSQVWFKVRASDNSGNITEWDISDIPISIDNTIPNIPIQNLPNVWFHENQIIDIDFTDNIQLYQIFYQINSNDNTDQNNWHPLTTNGVTPITSFTEPSFTENWMISNEDWDNLPLNSQNQGWQYIYFKVTDAAGNEYITTGQNEAFKFGKDIYPPTVYISYPEENQVINQSSVTATWYIDDQVIGLLLSGVQNIYYALDQNTNYTMVGPEINSVELSNLSEGNHTLYVYATDNAGNTHDVVQRNFSINTNINPPNPFSLLSPHNTTVSSLLPSFQWQSTTDPDGSGITYDLWYSYDPAFTGKVVIPELTTTYYQPALPLEDNSVCYWKVKATDGAGQVRWSDQLNWSFYLNVQNDAPAAFSLNEPLNGVTLNDYLPYFDWNNSTDPDPEDEVSYHLQLGTSPSFSNGTFTDVNLSSSEYSSPTPLQPNTTYYWRVIAIDNYGAQTFSSQTDRWFKTPSPTISASLTALPTFGEVIVGECSSINSYSISGSHLTGGMEISTPEGFLISTVMDGSYSGSVTLPMEGGTVPSTSIYVKFCPSEPLDYEGVILNTSANATSQTVQVNGTGTIMTPQISITTSSLDFGEVQLGTSSSPKTYLVSGSGLTQNIGIQAPAGFEMSTDPVNGYFTSLSLPVVNGQIIPTTISVVFLPSEITSYSGNIINFSPGANDKIVEVTGTGIPPTLDLINGMASYYKFDGDLTDCVGPINGTNSNTSDVLAGKINHARSFTGNNNCYVETGSYSGFEYLHNGSDFTISVWVKHNSNLPTNNSYHILGNTIGMDRRGIWFSVAANDVYFYVGRPNPYPVVSNQWLDVLSSNTEQWNHLVVTHDGTLSSNQYTLYVNGVNKGTASRVNSYSTGQSFYSMKIGINKTDGTIQPFLGEIDELGFWTRCLEATEVNELYNFGAGRQYPFSSTPPITNMIHLTTIQNAQNACYNASQMLEFGTAAPSFLVENGGSATMISGQTILLKAGTSVQSGGYLHGYIAPVGPFCPSPSLPSNTVAKDSQNSEKTLITEADQSGFTLFPNPTTGKFILELTNEPDIKGVDVELFNLFGQKILTQTLYAGRRHSFSIEEQQSGIYLFKISINGATEIRKIIKSPW